VLIFGTLLGILSAVGIQYMRNVAESSEALLPVVAIAGVGPHNERTARPVPVRRQLRQPQRWTR